MNENTNLFSVFSKKDCVLWTKDKKRYTGLLEVPAKGEFLLIEQRDAPCPAGALIRVDEVSRIELKRKRNFYAENAEKEVEHET